MNESISNAIQNGFDKVSDSIKDKISDFAIYIFKSIGKFALESSDIVCPIICLIALAFYIGGNRKAGKYVSGSFILYFILQALRGFIKA